MEPIEEKKPDEPVVTTDDKPADKKPTVKKPVVKPVVLIDARPIQDLNFSIRSINCLLRGGVKTVGDLISKSRDELLKIRHLGKKSLDEIDERLDEYGLTLSPYSSENTDTVEEEPVKDFANDKTDKELLDEILKDTEDSLDKVSDEKEEEKIIEKAPVKEEKKTTPTKKKTTPKKKTTKKTNTKK